MDGDDVAQPLVDAVMELLTEPHALPLMVADGDPLTQLVAVDERQSVAVGDMDALPLAHSDGLWLPLSVPVAEKDGQYVGEGDIVVVAVVHAEALDEPQALLETVELSDTLALAHPVVDAVRHSVGVGVKEDDVDAHCEALCEPLTQPVGVELKQSVEEGDIVVVAVEH